MLTITIAVNQNSFAFSGDTPFAEVRDLIGLWFDAIDGDRASQSMIDQFVARLKASNDRLAANVAAHSASA